MTLFWETMKINKYVFYIFIFRKFDSVLDAASNGAITAIQIVLAIVASLIAFLAFVYWIDGVLGWLSVLVGTYYRV